MPKETAEPLQSGLEALFAGGREAEAFARLRDAAESGDAQGQYLTGMLCYLGKGTDKDLGQALRWLTSAALRGHADAQYELAERHFFGEGVASDPAEADRWYRKAAEQNHAAALAVLSQKVGSGAGFSCNLGPAAGVEEA